MSLQERLKALLGSEAPDTLLSRGGDTSPQKQITLSLATARDWEYIEEFRGCSQVDLELSDVSAVAYLKVNSLNNPQYDLRTHRTFRGSAGEPIERLYLYNTAQPGLSLTIRTGSRLTDAVVNAALQATLVSLDGKVALESTQAALASAVATAAKQDTAQTALNAINGKVAEQATLSALASAVATSAKQDLQATAAKQDEAKAVLDDIYADQGLETAYGESSSTLLIQGDAVPETWKNAISLTAVKVVEILLLGYGEIVAKVTVRDQYPGKHCYAELRLNGVTQDTTNSTTTTPYTKTFATIQVSKGDLVQLYVYSSDISPETDQGQWRDFALYATSSRASEVIQQNE